MSALHVVFTIADARYAIDAADVLQMETFSGAVRVPGAAPHVVGVVQIRRNIVPVVDVRARFGLPAVQPSLDSRVIVVKDADRAVGLLVDSAREVVRIAPEQKQSPPDLVRRDGTGYVTSIARLGERVLMLIDPKRVIAEEKLDGR